MLEYDKKKVGQFLKATREKAGLTQAEVANKMGYTSPQFISNIERGASVAPLNLLARLMDMYGASPEPLIRIMLQSQSELLRKKLSVPKGGRG